jgi:DNA-directed RNA polymerase subunit RPC12/RpoP
MIAHGGFAMNPLKPEANSEANSDTNDTLSLPSHQVRYVAEHSNCAMCDTKLEIHHEINLNDLKVKEEAHCPSCGIRVRSKQHLMH